MNPHCNLTDPQKLDCHAPIVKTFLDYLRARGRCLCSATPTDASEFVQVLGNTYATSTVSKLVSELRTHYRLTDSVARNPFSDIHIAVPKRSLRKLHTQPLEVETVLAEIVTKDAKRIRDLALLVLVWHDQLTTGQLCQLNTEDVDLVAGCAQIRLRRKHRTLFLTRATLPYLQRWLAVRRLYQPLTRALFISLHWTNGRSQLHQRLSPRGVFAIRAAYSRRVS